MKGVEQNLKRRRFWMKLKGTLPSSRARACVCVCVCVQVEQVEMNHIYICKFLHKAYIDIFHITVVPKDSDHHSQLRL